MKRTFFLLVFAIVWTDFAFAQSAQQKRVDKIFEILDEDFAKYPFVIVTKPSRADQRGFTEDNSAERARINGTDPLNKDGTVKTSAELRRYLKEVAMDSQGKPIAGERVIIDIVQGGFRYDATIEFLPIMGYAQQVSGDGGPQRRQGAETSTAVRSRLYNLWQNILPERFTPAGRQQQSAVTAPNPAEVAPQGGGTSPAAPAASNP